MNTEWKIEDMHGRQVATRPIHANDTEYLKKCPDCEGEATKVIVELESMTANEHLPKCYSSWGWCGVCDIGG